MLEKLKGGSFCDEILTGKCVGGNNPFGCVYGVLLLFIIYISITGFSLSGENVLKNFLCGTVYS